MAIRHTIRIGAPIERVFALVDEPENLERWIDGLEETTYTSEPDAGRVGATFKQRIREGGRVVEYDGEVTAYERPTHLAVRIGNPQFSVDVDYRFTPVDGGTQLDYTAEVVPRKAAAWITNVLFGWLTRRISLKQLAKLKTAAESAG